MKKLIGLTVVMGSLAVYAQDSVEMQDIKVIGHQEGSSLVDFIPSVTKLQGKDLQKKRRTSLGDSLSDEAGVTSTQFGPSASRPVIRGLDGARIRVLQNSLGTLDASTQSVDHAIPVDILTLDSIEVVRGPMSLLYGSSAVGGVVNLVTNRIHSQFEEGLHSSALIQSESVNSGLSSGVALDYGRDGWMYHLDASSRNLKNQSIPGDARSDEEQVAEPLSAGAEEMNKTLKNSFNRQDSIAGGVSKIFSKGSIGASYNFFNTTYGTVAEEDVTIQMEQNRVEFHTDYKLEGGVFHKVQLKAAQSRYEHQELEDGEVGTTFKNDGNEVRVELLNKKSNLSGISGIQTLYTDFSAKGDEAFLPSTENQNIALFSYQELKLDSHTISLGARLETANITKEESENFAGSDEKDFTLYNASAGYQYKLTEKSSVSTSLSYTERNANFQELFSNGAHVATGSFEQGDAALEKEKAYALEMSYKRQSPGHTMAFNLYTQQFRDYIFLSPTGETDTDSTFPKYLYKSVDAHFYGADIENSNRLGVYKSGEFNLISRFDIVRARNITDKENLPRISPARVGIQLEYKKDTWSTDLELQYVGEQVHTAPNENNTDEYTLTNIGFNYDYYGKASVLNMFVRVRNIFDVTARNHVSVLKDIAPLPGRNIIAGAQVQF